MQLNSRFAMKFARRMHLPFCIFLILLDATAQVASDKGLPTSPDAKLNSLLKIYNLADTENKTFVTATTAPNITEPTDICESVIHNAIQNCNTPLDKGSLSNRTFATLSKALFESTILHDLRNNCTNGTWCLTPQHETRIVKSLNKNFLPFCSIGPCLLQMDDTCLTKEKRLMLASLLLLCKANELQMSNNCMLSLHKMTHVTMATTDVSKKNSTEGSTATDSQAKCSTEEQRNCTGSCSQVATQLYCTCATCQHQMHFLKEFGPWQWFFSYDKMDFCGLTNETDCTHFNSPEAVDFQIIVGGDGGLWPYLRQLDMGILIGAGIAGGATLILLSCLILFCLNRMRGGSDYNRHYIHYHEITAASESEDLTKDAFNDCNVMDLNKVYESID